MGFNSAFKGLIKINILGFSYRASFIYVTIRITNRCDFLYYVFISFFSSFPYMFRAFMSPSSGVFQAVVFMLPCGSCSALLIVCVSQLTGLWWWLRCTNKIEILSRKCACHTLFFVANVTIVRCCNFFFWTGVNSRRLGLFSKYCR